LHFIREFIGDPVRRGGSVFVAASGILDRPIKSGGDTESATRACPKLVIAMTMWV
jgi:hypothetical protein